MTKLFPTLFDAFLSDRAAFSTAHIRTPRASCYEHVRIRHALREMLPDNGAFATIGGFRVVRCETSKRDCYLVAGRRLTYAQAVALIEAGAGVEGVAA